MHGIQSREVGDYPPRDIPLISGGQRGRTLPLASRLLACDNAGIAFRLGALHDLLRAAGLFDRHSELPKRQLVGSYMPPSFSVNYLGNRSLIDAVFSG